MPQIVDRFTVSLDTELLAAFDRHIAAKGYENRSEAIRDLIRDALLATPAQRGDAAGYAFLTIVCDHRVSDAVRRLRACLTTESECVRGVLQLPIDEHRDGMAIALCGQAKRVRAASDRLSAIRGVTYGRLAALPVEERGG